MTFNVDLLVGVGALKTDLSLSANPVTYPIVRVGHAPVPTKVVPSSHIVSSSCLATVESDEQQRLMC